MIKSLIPVICPSVESSRSPSRRRGGSPTTAIITGVGGAWIWPGCSSWSRGEEGRSRSSAEYSTRQQFGKGAAPSAPPSRPADRRPTTVKTKSFFLSSVIGPRSTRYYPHPRFGQRVLSSATPSLLGDFTHPSLKKKKTGGKIS